MWNRLPFKVVQALFRSWGVLVPLFWRTTREKGKIAQLEANLNSHTVIPACWIFPLSQQLADPKLRHCPLAKKSSPAVGPHQFFFPLAQSPGRTGGPLPSADQPCLKILSPDKLFLPWQSLHRSLRKCSFTGRETVYKTRPSLYAQSWQVSGTKKSKKGFFSVCSIKDLFDM